MAACPEIARTGSDSDGVSISGSLHKLGGRKNKLLAAKWKVKWVVIARNFLYIFSSARDDKPEKIVGLDGCTVKAAPHKDYPYAFELTTCGGRKVMLAPNTVDDAARWIQVASLAGYDNATAHAAKQATAALMERLAREKREREAAEAAKGGSATGSDVDATSAGAGSGVGAGAGAPTPSRRDGSFAELQARAEKLQADNVQLVAEYRHLAEAMKSRDREHAVAQRKLQQTVHELTTKLGQAKDAARQAQAVHEAEVAELQHLRSTASPSAGAASADLRAEVAALQQKLAETERELRDSNRAREVVVKQLVDNRNEHARRAKTSEQEAQALAEALAEANTRIEELTKAAEQRAKDDAEAEVEASKSDSIRSRHESGELWNSFIVPATSSRPKSTGGVPGSGHRHHRSSSLMAASTSRSLRGLGDAVEEWETQYKRACALESTGSYDEALALFRDVLDKRGQTSGPRSIDVAGAMRDVARVLTSLEQYDQAAELYREVVSILVESLGEAHPNTAYSLTDLAASLRDQGDFTGAEESAARAVTCFRRCGPNSKLATATALYNLAGICKRQGKYAGAETSYNQALDIYRTLLTPGRSEIGDTLYQLGVLYKKQGATDKASTFFSKAASAYADSFGSTDRRAVKAARKASALVSAA